MPIDPRDIFRARAPQLFWRRFDDKRVLGRPSGEPIESEEAYVQVRLAEMYLGTTRKLWRKFSPLVHAFVTSGVGKEQHNIAGPGQLQDVSGNNLDRVIVLNQRLFGPIPYHGEELEVLAGLYSVPREDTAAALVNTVSTLSSLIGPTAVAGADIVKVVKTGVDGILGLGNTELRLGVNDTFSGDNPLRSGFLVGIGAPVAEVEKQVPLWLKDGRLVQGNSAPLAIPYDQHDYFVIQIERLERRPDWPGLPGLDKYQSRFSAILSKGDGSQDTIYKQLNGLWPEFREALETSPFLTRHDAGEIATDTQVDLKRRVASISSNLPFETREWRGTQVEEHDPFDVDFAAVPEATEAERAATAGLGAREPF
jgi:hypothetical protein